ncbi:eCIS core domain-containing protein [Chitinophaga japonensis]|uniref:Uncharacterized protein DUF4157 n=1 Tax=Chitinophaga japonensis TaxID=104662 RepID=A0A562T5Y7_CHIJA|nr:DUF4157 domain-containing protein [Chitinophaga japonensis]TWI88957.1 uncharacterized protein DUF4157 [Chitinophaga japonensis]
MKNGHSQKSSSVPAQPAANTSERERGIALPAVTAVADQSPPEQAETGDAVGPLQYKATGEAPPVGDPGNYRPASYAGASMPGKFIAQKREEESGASAPTPFVPQKEGSGNLPGDLKKGIESISGFAMDDVKVHYNSDKPAQLQALAYAQGTNIHLAPGQEQHLPHEAWHVVQQKQGRVQATMQMKSGVGMNDDPALEREADIMGTQALLTTEAPAQRKMAVLSSQQPVQRMYAALSPTGKARVDQQAEEKYAAKALEFEAKMAPLIMDDAHVHNIVDIILGMVKDIVDAWAKNTAQSKAATYESEFGWPPGDGYYGAFDMTATNIKRVFSDKGLPLRTKLKLVYNAVRNNNLSKWMKVAAIQLDREAKGQTRRSWNIKSDAHKVQHRPSGPTVVKTTTESSVAPDFAEDSGLKKALTPMEITEFAQIANRERVTSGFFTKRDVFTDTPSDIVKWAPATSKANREREGGGSAGLAINEQRTLTINDLPDLTDEEVDLVLKRRGNIAPDNAARTAYKADPATKVPWSQGGEFFNIKLGSESAREAATINARLEAGISGSTDLMLHAAKNLGVKNLSMLKTLRLGLAGWMMANRDHSFYEVFKAAESYGLPFIIDRANPGMEYEDNGNLFPMKKDDFAGLLADDGVLTNVYPKDYLSMTWKNYLAGILPNPAQTQADLKNTISAQGISAVPQGVMTERDTAHLNRLGEVTAAQTINGADKPALKQQAVRRIKLHTSYIHLGNTFGEAHAESLLNTLLLHHHPGKGLIKDEQRAILEKADIPKVILDFATPVQLTALEAVRAAVQAAVPTAPGTLAMGGIDAALMTLTIGATQKAQVKAALIRRYHGDAYLPGGVGGAGATEADRLNRISQLEQIAQMEKTSGTWYTWNSRDDHLSKIASPSLRDATSNVPSTQGPGLYIGRKVTTSSGYGAAPGKRVMVVKMQSVPTINILNAAQKERLRLLAGGVMGDALDVAGAYSQHHRGEFLMIYGAGNFGRLTTNKGVRLTIDLKEAPVADLRAEFHTTKWSGHSKQNFIDQAGESNLSLAGW